MKKKYEFTDYDENLCLRVSPALWIAMLFLFRAYLIALLSVVNFKDSLALINMFYSNNWQVSLGALAGTPVFVVLFSWKARKPGASARTQWFWRNGRGFLLASAVLNILAVFVPLLIGASRGLDVYGLAQVALCVGIIVFLFVSKRVSDTFSEFPEAAEVQSAK